MNPNEQAAWLTQREKGSRIGLRIVLGVVLARQPRRVCGAVWVVPAFVSSMTF